MLFDGLTRIDQEGEPILAVAKEISLSEDGLRYTFQLQETKWSNGQPVTAHDFEYAWKKILSPDFASPFAALFYPIENAKRAKIGQAPPEDIGVRATSEYTLEVTLAHPAPYFLYMIANPIFSPIPAALEKQNPKWHREADTFVSNGPFRLASWDHDVALRVEKNPYYHDSLNVKLDAITACIIKDPHTMLQLFEQGELDWAGAPLANIPLSSLETLKAKGKLHSAKSGGVFMLRLNVERPPLHNANLRRALSAALDRQTLVRNIMHGNERAAYSIVPPVIALDGGRAFDADPELARQYLEHALSELGYTRDTLPPIVLSYASEEGQRALSQAIVGQWNAVLGIEVKLEALDPNLFFANMVSGKMQMGGSPWYTLHNDPISNLEHVKSKKRYNMTRWEDPIYRDLLDAADQELNPHARDMLLRKAEDMVLNELPLIPIYVTSYNYLKRPEVHAVCISELGQIDFKWAELSKQEPDDRESCTGE